tara:strand:- start:58 stop:273 length:216 start_codon:yes stop_codon:yes gene_type:complete
MKTYEVEFKSTTYRTYHVEAPSKKFAEEAAIEELQMDTEVSNAWVENAEIESIEDIETQETWLNANGQLND